MIGSTLAGLAFNINISGGVGEVVLNALSIVSLIIALIAVVAALGGAVNTANLEYMQKMEFITILRSDLKRFEILIIVMVVTSALSLLSILFSSEILGALCIGTFLAGLFYMLFVVLRFVSRVIEFTEKLHSQKAAQ